MMKYSNLGRTNIEVSRLGLGTAEIGFAYGIGTRSVPSESEAIDLLKQAVDLGITFFDTANYYGLAEERIGKSGILKDPSVVVETKCAQFLEKGEYGGRDELEQKIRTQVASSLTSLKTDSLQILMLHGPSQEQIEKGELIEILRALKKEGKILFTGVSTRGEDAPLAAIQSGFFDVIQVAYSIVDQRMASRIFPATSEANIGVVNRSVLLKGSLTSLRNQLPVELKELRETADQAEKIARSLDIDLPTLAIRFAISNPMISTSLIGTNKMANISKSIKALEAGPLPAEVIHKLEKLAIDDPNQVDPAKWPKIS